MRRRRTASKVKVFAALLACDEMDAWGFELAKAAGLATGTIYPILISFEADGYITSKWEVVDPSSAGRPRRRLYELTGVGRQVARAHVDEALAEDPKTSLLPGLRPS